MSDKTKMEKKELKENCERMIKKILILIMIILVSLVAIQTVISLETRIIETKVTVTYTPSGNCTTFNVSGVLERRCVGSVTISGENLLKEFVIGQNGFVETVENNVVRQFGNESDVTGVLDKLNECLEKTDLYYECESNKANITSQFIECNQDRVYIDNLTSLKTQYDDLNTQFNGKQQIITDRENEVKTLTTQRWLFLVGGLIIGFLIIKWAIPYFKGRIPPKDESDKQFNSSARY